MGRLGFFRPRYNIDGMVFDDGVDADIFLLELLVVEGKIHENLKIMSKFNC